MVEIYGLFDPDTDELRYVGKAKNAAQRLRTHLLECKRHRRPIHNWLRALLRAKKTPSLRVLESVPEDQWEAAERRLIAQYRITARLLNVADGGAMPSQTALQRQNAAKAANKAVEKRSKEWKANHKANQDLSRLYTRLLKEKDYRNVYKLKFMMRCYAELKNSPSWWLSL